jgi:hypothetical protein
MNSTQFTGLIRQQYPQYANQSDEWILDTIREVIVSQSPAADKVYQILNRYKVSVGIVSGWFQKRFTKQQADAMEHAMRAAKAANEIDMSLKSSMTGIPREFLGEAALIPIRTNSQKELVTHTTDENIRFEKSKAEIQYKLEYALSRVRLATERTDAKQWLKITKDVAKLEQELEALRGGPGQKALHETSSSESASDDEATEDE